MQGRVAVAAADNAHWCDLVCRAQAIPTSRDACAWAARRRSPDGYPDAVTLRPGASPDDVLRRVDAAPGCSVKDCFADLDLTPSGFRELFTASWLFLDAPGAPPAPRSSPFTVLTAAHELTAWAGAHGLVDAFRPALLREPGVRILAAYDDEGVSAGAVLSRSGPVVGVSNVFTVRAAAEDAWRGVVAAAARDFPGLPLTGWEHDDDLVPPLANGFEVVGPLRVWLREG